jgi:hypothetical protein
VVGGDDVVERAVLGAAAREANHDHVWGSGLLGAQTAPGAKKERDFTGLSD